MYVCLSLCTTVMHNTAQSSSDYLPSYPPDKHQSSDAVYWRGGGVCKTVTLELLFHQMVEKSKL